MGASEQVTDAVTLSGSGVTLRKEFVEDEYSVPTVRFVVENESEGSRTVGITEEVPDGFSVDAVGFHPEYGAEHWTCYEDERAEFERDLPAGREYETVYGINIEDVDEAGAFMTEPRLIVDGEVVGEDVGDDREISDTEVDKELMEEDGSVADASLDAEIPDDGSDGAGSSTDDASAGGPGSTVAADGSPTPVPGPESGSVIERLIEELRRNDLEADQRELLREQLDLGVPSETKARIDRLSTRVETVAAYADALEDFLDEEGTAQEVIRDFEEQVEPLREDVDSIREQTGSNATEIADLSDDLGSLETQVDGLEGALDDVADRADDVEDSLSTTDAQLENVESDLRQAEDRIEENVAGIDELDRDMADVEGDLSDVEERVTATEADVETVDDAAADLRDDLDDVENDVAELEETTEDNADAIDSVEAYAEELDEDIGAVEDDVEDIIEWREELGEMFQ